MVQVHHDEGVANRIDPESCADTREGIGEALTGERIGQPLSRESTLILGADVVPVTEGNTDGRDNASAQTARRGLRHWHVRTLSAWEPGDLMVGPVQHACWRWPTMRSPGSQAESVRTCQCLRPRRAVWALALSRPSVLPSVTGTTSAPRMRVLSRLNGWPMRSPVNASPIRSRVSAHDSGSMRFATPSS